MPDLIFTNEGPLMKPYIALAALAASLSVVPSFAATVLTTNTTDNSGSSGATTFLNFNTTGSAISYAAGYGYTLTRDGASGIFQQSGSAYSNTPNGNSSTGTAVSYTQPNASDGAFYGVGGVQNGVQSYATFLGTQALSSISLFIGTLDAYNQISLLDQNGNSLATFSGTDINGGTAPNGSSNLTAIFTGTQGTNYYGISVSNLGNNSAFEFDNLAFNAAPAAAVPEPATWAMMLIGFGGIGAALRRRRSVERPVAI